ncbi:MAG: DegT/DnrJ/EryC1/StrS family aminotransferase, partial [Planctomycetota bacterium]|nr:DegT/DnrJ/EryC1/StrS family aminotransferase [Planctomycetota bacterium]
VGVLSFGGSKLLTSGRGGAVVTSNAQLAQRIRLYTQRGNDAYPLSEMQAAVLIPQLKRLDIHNTHRRQRVMQLVAALSTSDIRTAMNLPVAPGDSKNQPAFYKSAFLMQDGVGEQGRIQFCDSARRAGVPVDPGFSGLHKIHGKRRFRAVSDLVNANQLHKRLITLHHTALLDSSDTILQIADLLRINAAVFRSIDD